MKANSPFNATSKTRRRTVFFCDVCGKPFNGKSTFDIHLRTHSGDKPYRCKSCGKCFRQANHLASHETIACTARSEKLTSGNVKTFSCDKCSKVFLYGHVLKRHLLTHSGERPYVCARCGKGFRQASHLNGHRKMVCADSLPERRFQCSFCLRRFVYKQSMKLHTRIHTDEKPFMCSTCGRAFRQSGNLKNHIRRIHNQKSTGLDDNIQCSTCGKVFSGRRAFSQHEKVHKQRKNKPSRTKRCEVKRGSVNRSASLLPEFVIVSKPRHRQQDDVCNVDVQREEIQRRVKSSNSTCTKQSEKVGLILESTLGHDAGGFCVNNQAKKETARSATVEDDQVGHKPETYIVVLDSDVSSSELSQIILSLDANDSGKYSVETFCFGNSPSVTGGQNESSNHTAGSSENIQEEEVICSNTIKQNSFLSPGTENKPETKLDVKNLCSSIIKKDDIHVVGSHSKQTVADDNSARSVSFLSPVTENTPQTNLDVKSLCSSIFVSEDTVVVSHSKQTVAADVNSPQYVVSSENAADNHIDICYSSEVPSLTEYRVDNDGARHQIPVVDSDIVNSVKIQAMSSDSDHIESRDINNIIHVVLSEESVISDPSSSEVSLKHNNAIPLNKGHLPSDNNGHLSDQQESGQAVNTAHISYSISNIPDYLYTRPPTCTSHNIEGKCGLQILANAAETEQPSDVTVFIKNEDGNLEVLQDKDMNSSIPNNADQSLVSVLRGKNANESSLILNAVQASSVDDCELYQFDIVDEFPVELEHGISNSEEFDIVQYVDEFCNVSPYVEVNESVLTDPELTSEILANLVRNSLPKQYHLQIVPSSVKHSGDQIKKYRIQLIPAPDESIHSNSKSDKLHLNGPYMKVSAKHLLDPTLRQLLAEKLVSMHRKFHVDRNCVVCEICKRTFVCKSLLSKEPKQYLGHIPFRCLACNNIELPNVLCDNPVTEKPFPSNTGSKETSRKIEHVLCSKQDESLALLNQRAFSRHHRSTFNQRRNFENLAKENENEHHSCVVCGQKFQFPLDCANHTKTHYKAICPKAKLQLNELGNSKDRENKPLQGNLPFVKFSNCEDITSICIKSEPAKEITELKTAVGVESVQHMKSPSVKNTQSTNEILLSTDGQDELSEPNLISSNKPEEVLKNLLSGNKMTKHSDETIPAVKTIENKTCEAFSKNSEILGKLKLNDKHDFCHLGEIHEYAGTNENISFDGKISTDIKESEKSIEANTVLSCELIKHIEEMVESVTMTPIDAVSNLQTESYCSSKGFERKHELTRHMLEYISDKDGSPDKTVLNRSDILKKLGLLEKVSYRRLAVPYKHKCPICSKILQSTFILRRHVLSHFGLKPYKCNICGKRFPQKGHLVEHKRHHDGKKNVICETCGKTYVHKKSLVIHQRLHSNTRRFVCPVCDKTFTQSGHLKSHALIHTEEKHHLCEICAKAFKSKSGLRIHNLVHTHSRRHACETCGKTFQQSSGLKTHKLTHGSTQSFKCAVCDREFTYAHVLKRHQLTHGDVRLFRCDTCGKVFSQAPHLKVHQQMHANERLYECSVCLRRFNTAASVQLHLVTHVDKKPFSCSWCGNTFCSPGSLKQHERKHTESYACSSCGKVFTTVYVLLKHRCKATN